MTMPSSELSTFHGLRKVALRMLGEATECVDKIEQNPLLNYDEQTRLLARCGTLLDLVEAHVKVARLFQ